MSLKSFDKFCEDMILGRGGMEKEILDERQNQVRTKITVETLTIYIISVFINSFVMDMIYRWCESYTASMFLLMALCYLYGIIRNAAKGSLFGVKGTRSAKFVAFFMMLQSFLFAFKYLFPILDNKQGYFFSEGRVTDDFIFAVTFMMFFVSGIMIFAFAKKYDKKMGKESDTNNSINH